MTETKRPHARRDPVRLSHGSGAAPLVAVTLVILGLAAMFSGGDRSAPVARAGQSWWLGVDLVAASPSSAGPAGVIVRRLLVRSPARPAGLLPGDRILSINGDPVLFPQDVESLLKAPVSSGSLDLVVSRGDRTVDLRVALRTVPDFRRDIGIVLLILLTVFAGLYLTAFDRVSVVGTGAVLSVIAGTLLGFYDQQAAFGSIRMGTLSLLLGMGVLTSALEKAGVFTVVARRISVLADGDWSRLLFFTCVVTYALSTFVNNLTTILVVLPVTLVLVKELGADPRPFVTGLIVSSNLGGASSMVGDFPNMLIASETDLAFRDFLLYMMPPCLVQLAVTIWFLKKLNAPEPETAGRPAPLRPEQTSTDKPAKLRPLRMTQSLVVLVAVIVCFLFSGRLGLRPATIALAGGFAMLLLWNRAAPRLISGVGCRDLLFFAALFVLVGSAEASGLLDTVGGWIADLAGGRLLSTCLVLMWVAAVATAFLNAGPTTALFVPVVKSLGIADPSGLLWWSLSLGVCAGSSATLTGATAGPVALSKLEEFDNEARRKGRTVSRERLSFASYARAGVPLMFAFLFISSVYVGLLTACR